MFWQGADKTQKKYGVNCSNAVSFHMAWESVSK